MKALVISKSVLVGLIMTSALAQAASHREAVEICESMSFSSSKNTCFAYINTVKNEYFDRGAIEVCKSMSFDGGKITCVRNITSKFYESYEIQNCLTLSFDNQKNECLVRGGEVVRHDPRPRQPQRPQHGDYVQGQTMVWENAGVFTAPKGVAQPIELNFATHRGVVEVRLATRGASVRITRAYAITASGEHLELESLRGSIGKRGQRLVRLNPQFAVRLSKLVLEITSPNLIGSRGQLEVVAGMTR